MAYNKYAKLETLNNKDSQFNFIKLFASGYNRGRIISLIVFTKIPCDELWTSLATYEKGIFYICRVS